MPAGDPDILLIRRPGPSPREDVLVAINLGTRPARFPGAALLLGSHEGVGAVDGAVVLPPDSAAWLRG